jgi:hypothetical protein
LLAARRVDADIGELDHSGVQFDGVVRSFGLPQPVQRRALSPGWASLLGESP